jgi:hypothetical protein
MPIAADRLIEDSTPATLSTATRAASWPMHAACCRFSNLA